MKTIKTPIIPIEQTFVNGNQGANEINKKAICIFAATGFFLDTDSYFTNQNVLQPAKTYILDSNQKIVSQETHFNWFYQPRDISFNTALDEFTDLFEGIIKKQTQNKNVILPLSGGLDSRSQAVALKQIKANVQSYSYSFAGGFKEHKIAEQIAKSCDFNFTSFRIPSSYLWDKMDDASRINGCYTEFTQPRQLAVLEDLKKMKGEFSLGHWGDVLFNNEITDKEKGVNEVALVYKKIIKKGGLSLATALWNSWNLDGEFETYFKTRIQVLLDRIHISHTGAKIRAFKSLYWAPRYTSVGLQFFEDAHPIHMPYYNDSMCKFICEIPEKYLADRKLQIAYIKNRNPKVAAIPWQDQMPYNLFHFHKNKSPQNLVYRLQTKLFREARNLFGNKYIQRNWELQFLGKRNDEKLQQYLFDADFLEFVGQDVVARMYQNFKTKDPVFYSHAVSMLLTLSVWNKKHNGKI